MNDKDLKSIAKTLFLEGFSVDDILEFVPKGKSTIYNWINEGEWKEQKIKLGDIAERQMIIAANLTKRIERITSEEDFNPDEVNKLALATERMTRKNPKVDVLFFYAKRYVKYISEQDLERDQISMFIEQHQKFVKNECKRLFGKDEID